MTLLVGFQMGCEVEEGCLCFTLACKLIVFEGYNSDEGREGRSVMIDDGNMYIKRGSGGSGGHGWG